MYGAEEGEEYGAEYGGSVELKPAAPGAPRDGNGRTARGADAVPRRDSERYSRRRASSPATSAPAISTSGEAADRPLSTAKSVTTVFHDRDRGQRHAGDVKKSIRMPRRSAPSMASSSQSRAALRGTSRLPLMRSKSGKSAKPNGQWARAGRGANAEATGAPTAAAPPQAPTTAPPISTAKKERCQPKFPRLRIRSLPAD